MEYGLDVSLPIYSGGLGVLSGDHMKTSSDLGLPLVGVGLLYRRGYFHQRLNHDGWQMEEYPVNDFYNLPISEVVDAGGEPLKIEVPIAERITIAKVWKIQVGRIADSVLRIDRQRYVAF